MLNTTRKSGGRKFVHRYKPRGGCVEVLESQEAELLISGPAGTGKSRACLEKIYLVCLMTPNTRALILRKTLRSLGSSALVTWRNHVAKEAIATGYVVYYGGSNEQAAQYRFKNGSTVTIGGLDNPTRIMSTDYDIIYVQEATEITVDDHEMCTTRLRNWNLSFQQLIMDCNPAGDKHWLKLRADNGVLTLIESRHEDNPRLFNEDGTKTAEGIKYIDGILDKLTGVRYLRLRLGKWVSAEGIVYEEFDRYTHILPWELDEEGNKLPLPYEWPRFWAIDFGYTNPFVLKCYAQGPDGEHYMYREIYMTGRTIKEHAATIMNLVTKKKEIEWYDHFNKVTRVREEIEWIEPEPHAIICDWDAQGRRTFENETGLHTVKAIKNVSEGINAHKERLKVDKNGLTRYYIMEDSLVELDQSLRDALLPTCTEEEYASYVWRVNSDGRKLDEPVKEHDHGMDTDRYHTAYHDLKGRARATQI